MSNSQEKDISFHVGLGKTGSTYLQYNVFPKFKDVHYIQRTSYYKLKEVIEESNHQKIFTSNEFDDHLERELEPFSKLYPNTKTIMFLRRQDSWMASQYRRYIKNARPHTFKEFFDIEGDTGTWKRNVPYFYPKIEFLKKHFTPEPLIIIYDDFKEKPVEMINLIARYIGVTYDLNDISLSPVHKSYNEKQLKSMRWISKYTYRGEKEEPKNRFIKYLIHYTYIAPLRYSWLYGSLLVPKTFMGSEPLIAPEELEAVREFYKEDWEKSVQASKDSIALVPDVSPH